MNIRELKQEITSGNVSPVYVISGSEEFVKSMAIARIRSVVKNFPDVNYVEFVSPGSQEVIDALYTIPFGDDYKVVTISGVSDYSPYYGYFSSPSPSSVLVIIDGQEKQTKKGELPAALKKVECVPLAGKEMLVWLAFEAKQYSAALEEDAGGLLVEYCKSDMFRLQGEIRKLASLRVGGIITAADVKSLVVPDIEYTVWQLADEIAAKNYASAIKIYEKMDVRPDTRVLVFGAIYGHFRRLFYSSVTRSDEQLAEYLQMKPFMIGRTRAAARKMSKDALKRIILFLAEYDELSKNGKIPAQVSGETLIAGAINALN